MSKKRSIEWHENCLTNMKLSLQRELDRLEGVRRLVEDLRKQVDFAELQIATAKAKGIESFDDSRFCVKKKG